MTEEFYRVPAFALLCALIAVFGALYLRARTTRRLLWLIGWVMAAAQLGLRIIHADQRPAGLALYYTSLELAPLMFMGSVSQLRLWKKIPYVIVFGFPLVLFGVLMSLFPVPGSGIKAAILICMILTVSAAVHWSVRKNLSPAWFSILFTAIIGLVSILLTLEGHYMQALQLVHTGVFLMTAILFLRAYRRFSPGVVFTICGLLYWGLPLHVIANNLVTHETGLVLLRLLNLVKAVTAVGMIVLVLEEELTINEAARQRDHRARIELEQYSRLDLFLDLYQEQTEQYDNVCEVIAAHSRFGQTAIFLHNVAGVYGLVGKAGMEGVLQGALHALAGRLTQEKLQAFRATEYFRSEIGNMAQLDLTPLFEPGDELKQLNYTCTRGIPICNRAGGLEGLLLLSGLRDPDVPLRTDDLLPLELLVARLSAARENNLLIRRVMQSEKLAGLGQIAGGVAHELNNPLTVVMGYAELLLDDEVDEGEAGSKVHEQALVIRNEARRMKQIIESIVRFWRPSQTDPETVRIGPLVEDIEQMRRAELESKGIDFRVSVANDLPAVRANSGQLRQVLLHLLNNSVNAFLGMPPTEDRRLRLEVSHVAKRVRILVADTGPGFSEPQRIFDPYFTATKAGEGVGLGLSLCYSIVREHGGDISATNLLPHGSAVVIELPAHDDAGLSPVEIFARSMATVHSVSTLP
jgi:two-component system NtrC family sensor kinase